VSNGYWYLDESPSNVVSGTFRFDPKAPCSIELLGNFGTRDLESGSVKILRGVSSTNDRLTLLNCTPTNKRLQRGLFEINDLVCELALVGNYHPAEDLNFVKCSMRFDNLDSWVKSDYVKVDRYGGSALYRTLSRIDAVLHAAASFRSSVRLVGSPDLTVTFKIEI
jgi:hypothetical protein